MSTSVARASVILCSVIQGDPLIDFIPSAHDFAIASVDWRRGESPADVKKSIKGSPWMADRRIAEARATDVDTLRRAVEVLADLELDTRGASELSDDTVGLRAIAAIAAN